MKEQTTDHAQVVEEQTTDRAQLMGEQSTFRLLLKFSVPAVVGMMVQALYNFVDRIYIGRAVGSVGIAATTVSMPIMMLGFAFALMIGVGATALISIRLGEQNKDQAEQVMGNASVMLFLTSIGLMALGLVFLTPALRVFGATDTILPYARDYMRIILFGWLFQMFGFGLNNFPDRYTGHHCNNIRNFILIHVHNFPVFRFFP